MFKTGDCPIGITTREINNILVMKPYGGLGDLLLSTPVMHSLKEEFPRARLTVMAREAFVDVVEGNPKVDRVIPVPADFTRGFKNFSRQLSLVREGSYDLALVLWTSAREAYLLTLAGIPLRVGQAGRLMYSFLFTHRVERRSDRGDEESHQVETLLDYVRVLGIEPKNRELDFFIPPQAQAHADSMLEEMGIGRDDFLIGFNCTKGLPVTPGQWPVEKFSSFARSLAGHFGAKMIFTGTNGEKAIVDAVMSGLSGPFYSMAGKTTIKEAAALIRRCRLFVSPDSGPMHIAAALKVPVVGIYGLKGDYPRRWAPYNCPHRIVRLQEIPCQDRCIKETCQRFRCYEAIPDGMVVQAADSLIQEAGTKN